jgi:hypothetical protein
VKSLLALAASLFLSLAHAQTLSCETDPHHRSYAPGGTSDILARQIGPKLTEAWA